MYYLVKYNNNIIGCYNDYAQAELFILSCYQNNFMTSIASIVKCHENSCYFVDNTYIHNDNDDNDDDNDDNDNVKLKLDQAPKLFPSPFDEKYDNPEIKLPTFVEKYDNPEIKLPTFVEKYDNPEIKLPSNLFSSPEFIEKYDNKYKVQHEINLLKQKKEKLEQSKRVYESDITIYNIFKEKHEKNNEEIPDIFIKKYNVFKKLENENKLSWENFVKEYKHENMYNDHFNVGYHESLYQEFDISSEKDSSYVSSDDK